MALVTRTERECDVYGTKKNICEYRVEVQKRQPDGTYAGIWQRDAELSPRGLDRLEKFIVRGTTKPAAGEKSAEQAAESPS